MIFVFLAVFILVISFLIALSTLVVEQRSFERSQRENEDLTKKTQEHPQLNQDVATRNLASEETSVDLASLGENPSKADVMAASLGGSYGADLGARTGASVNFGSASHKGAWWEGLIDKDSGMTGDAIPKTSDEAKSIELIKAELARIKENKSGPSAAKTEDEPIAKQKVVSQGLSGEFSPKDMVGN